MQRTLFVTATNTDVGKTHTTLHLMEAAARRGLAPAAFKPIETGVTAAPPDGTALWEATRRLNPRAADLALETVVPLRYTLPAAPWVAKGANPINWTRLDEAFKSLTTICDILFVEGAGGLMVPIDEAHFMIDLPRRWQLGRTLLVTPGRLGSINDTLLSLEALRARNLETVVAVNLRPGEAEAFARITLPYYQEAPLPHFRLPDETEACLSALLR